jgi:hypothetical protein
MEFQAGVNKWFLNHSEDSEDKKTYGKLINHSKRHPNLRKSVYQMDGKPEVLFETTEVVAEGTQLSYDYGDAYQGLSDCVSGCGKCFMLQGGDEESLQPLGGFRLDDDYGMYFRPHDWYSITSRLVILHHDYRGTQDTIA